MTNLCVSIFVESIEQAKRDIAAASEAGADLAELRLDLQPDIGDVDRLLNSFRTSYILTCRPEREGGLSNLTDAERLRYLRELGALHGDSYLDVEKSALPELAYETPNPLIVSSHDFTGRPARLYNIVDELNRAHVQVGKIAWMARTIRDNIEAFEILLQRQHPTIALCMGESGFLSRVLAKKFGAFLTYVSLRPTEVTAPGQPTIHEIKNLYRWDAIDRDTKVYGVVGAPVAHSVSPAVHNAAFADESINAVYLPMLVNPGYESFKAFMECFLAFAPLDLSGLSITIPHKENALRYLKERGATIDPVAGLAGSVNTIAIHRDLKSQVSDLRGFNTDFDAILDTLTSSMHITREALGELRVAVIGAGGTGRTAVAALASVGATVVVYNRTLEKADALAKEFDGHTGKVVAARIEKLCDSCCHIFINTTPVGMHPNVDASPLGDRLPKFTSETVVFDTIYNPQKTKLLRQAEKAGARTIGGSEMFLRQAAAQFQIWTGRAAPTEVMHRAFESRLQS